MVATKNKGGSKAALSVPWLGGNLEGDPRTKPDRAAIVDTFLTKAADQAAKLVVALDVVGGYG